MRALVWHGPNELAVEDKELPTPGEGEALVRVSAAGICGSDVHGYTGASGRRSAGMVMGHEFAGVAEAGADGLEGRRVAVNPLFGDGTCELCRAGLNNLCEARRSIGVNMGSAGAFAEYVAAPVGNLVPLASEITDAEGALAEPLAVAVRAVNLSRLREGEPTLVLGGGTIGLCVLLVLRSRNIGPVYLTDTLAHRLDVARSLGAEALAADGDAVARVRERTGGVGVRASLDAVGIAPTIRQALEATRRGGEVVLIGLAKPGVELALYELVPQERVLRGSYAYTSEEYREAVRLINERVVDVRPLVERTVSLDEAPNAFADLASGRDESVKVVVQL